VFGLKVCSGKKSIKASNDSDSSLVSNENFSEIQGSHAVLKLKIGFQDLEKVLNLAKMSLRY